MKKLILAAIAAAALQAPADTVTNGWTAPIAVVQTAACVKINSITITTLPSGQVSVTVAWSWLDGAGKTIRTGVSRYNEEEISAKLTAKGASVDQLRTLFLSIAADEATAP